MTADEAGAASPLAARLTAPARQASADALAAGWFMGEVRLTVAGPVADAPAARLAGRIRGALGTVLRQSASAEAVAGRPCPWDPPCALDALYRVQGRLTAGLEIPKPYVVALDREDGLLRVNLGLVGFASDWLEEVAAALVVAWREHLPGARGSSIVGRRIRGVESVPVPYGARRVVLAFESPLELRFRDGPPASADAALGSLLASLGNRVSGLARWQDAAIDADWHALKAAAAGITMRVLAQETDAWWRGSRLQARSIPMRGDRPALLLEGDLAPFLPFLAIGAAVHVGSHAALGLGRYRLIVPREA